MLLALLAAVALAAAEPAQAPAATGVTEVSPVTVPAPKPAEDAKAEKPKQICFNERPTGSRRITRVCYDRDVYDETRERLSRQHVRESPSFPGGRVGVSR
ncbi:hypothetical protein [Phenylobacterium sp.]|jgi:hypothetical protein|uniref:hypothetical protein n=1 Tax=Phenylobacterium sp. TaxID=1871053 RepID=UPI002F944E79